MKKKIKLISLLTFMHIIMFSIFRLLSYIYHFDLYNNLNFSKTLFAFFDGIRFDISIIFTFSGIFFLAMLFPFKKALPYKISAIFLMLLFNIYFIVLSSDILFFENVKRHISDEIILMSNDLIFFIDYAKGNYFFYFLIFFLFLLNYYSLKKLFAWINENLKYWQQKNNFFSEAATIIIFIFVSVFLIRGTPDGRPINIIDAFSNGSNQYGNLVLNGVFTAYHSSRAYKPASKNHMDEKKAFEKASKFLVEDYEYIPDLNYPLARKYKSLELKDEKNYNVVIILLESWTYKFIDSFSGSNYKVTPNLDRIYSEALVFKNFYANGQRSIFGITSTLISIPQIQGLPYLGKGLEISNIFRPAKYFNSKGYNTIAAQSSTRRSFRVSSITKALGFKEFYGMEDIPVIFDYDTHETPNFGWDYDTLDFFFHKLNSSEKPFFSFVFTGTTHEKFILPHKQFEKYPHEPYGLNGYLNTLFYSDYSLGNFFEKARATDWFKNTIFIITADHALGKFQKDSINDKFKIPLLIYAPDIISKGISNELGSQVDIMPTILDITGADSSFAGIGKSLLRKSNKRFAFLNNGRLMTLLTDKGKIDFIDSKIISTDLRDQTSLNSLKEIFYSIDQSIYQTIKKNKFFKLQTEQ
ncbi:MAG: sulfatase-like hydrolase/transferase [Desulfobacteraceae bacterium]|nr:sulfatase-like hydrolase/transferase [Desulfobacteraceae bacterium]